MAEETTAAPTGSGRVYRIGTRSSRLAMIQTNIVRDALLARNPTATFEITSMKTMGDKDKVTALHSFGAKSLWTLELEALLLEREVDLIVHSLKGATSFMDIHREESNADALNDRYADTITTRLRDW